MNIIRYLTTEPDNKCLVDIVHSFTEDILNIHDIFIYPIINKEDDDGIITEIVGTRILLSDELKIDYANTMHQILVKELKLTLPE